MNNKLFFAPAFNIFLVVFCLLLWSSQGVYAGVWPKGKGKGYVQLGGTSKSWDGRYQGSYSNTIYRYLWRDVRESTMSIYAEYGLTDKLTLVADVPYKIMHTASERNEAEPANNMFDVYLPEGKLNGLGNISLAAQYPVLQKGIVLTTQAKVTAATAKFDAASGLRTGYDAWAFAFSGMLGKGFSRSYLTFELGAEVMTNKYGSSIISNFEYGISPNDKGKTYFIVNLNGRVALGNGQYNNATSEQTATFLDNQGYVSYGAKVYQKITKHFSANVLLASGFAVVNQGTQPSGIYGGIAYEW